jgi:hypothetical protein
MILFKRSKIILLERIVRYLSAIHFPAFRFNLFINCHALNPLQLIKGFPLQSRLKDKRIDFLLTSSLHTLKSNSILLFLKKKIKDENATFFISPYINKHDSTIGL